uniref:Uncharacterized protein n=1 Tax=Arundo donax TaxID=35708 RepID=A0A0A9F4T2_ARUDO
MWPWPWPAGWARRPRSALPATLPRPRRRWTSIMMRLRERPRRSMWHTASTTCHSRRPRPGSMGRRAGVVARSICM